VAVAEEDEFAEEEEEEEVEPEPPKPKVDIKALKARGLDPKTSPEERLKLAKQIKDAMAESKTEMA